MPDEKAPESMSEAEMLQVKKNEVRKSCKDQRPGIRPFALAIEGKNPTSEAFAQQIEQLGIQGKSQTSLRIAGGSLGLSQEVMQRSNTQISFGKMTYPHQLIDETILVEQIYRAFRINTGAPYHK